MGKWFRRHCRQVLRVVSVEGPRWTTLAGRMTPEERRAALRAVGERMRRKDDEWPTVINGHITRPRHGACPSCGAPEEKWCAPGCTRLDPMDYR